MCKLTPAKIDRHTEAVDELDVEGILAFAERILPRASDLWVQASLDYKQRLQELFFPEGIAFDGNRFNRTAATAPLFNYLAPSESTDEKMVNRAGTEPGNQQIQERPLPDTGAACAGLSANVIVPSRTILPSTRATPLNFPMLRRNRSTSASITTTSPG